MKQNRNRKQGNVTFADFLRSEGRNFTDHTLCNLQDSTEKTMHFLLCKGKKQVLSWLDDKFSA